MILNLLTDLTDPDDIPDIYGGNAFNRPENLITIIIILTVICLIELVVLTIVLIKHNDKKSEIEELKDKNQLLSDELREIEKNKISNSDKDIDKDNTRTD